MNRRLPIVRTLYLLQIALLIAVATAVFQLFLRYEYVSSDGTTWRIDRVTQQICAMRSGRPVCKQPAQIDPAVDRGVALTPRAAASMNGNPAHS